MWLSSLVDSVVSSHWNPATLCDRGSSRAGPADVTLSAIGYLSWPCSFEDLGHALHHGREDRSRPVTAGLCALLAGDICMALTADPPPDFLRGRSVVIFCKGRNRQVRLRCRRSVVGTKFCEPKDGGSFSPKSLQLVIIAAAASTWRIRKRSPAPWWASARCTPAAQPSAAARSRQSAWRCLSTRWRTRLTPARPTTRRLGGEVDGACCGAAVL